jgi:hypothetical protein
MMHGQQNIKEKSIESRGAIYQPKAHTRTQQRVTQMYKNTSARDLNIGKFFDL